MTPEELAELEMHLAAGTDLPAAMAAMEDDAPPAWAHVAGLIAAVIVGSLIALFWFSA